MAMLDSVIDLSLVLTSAAGTASAFSSSSSEWDSESDSGFMVYFGATCTDS